MTSPLGIWIVRAEAEKLGRKLEAGLGGKLCGVQINRTNREAFSDHFTHYRQWILIMATGIAVRYLQDLPKDKAKDKASDPGVVVLDEGCRFAISLLGGHEGGANELAYRVANLTEAVPVITTATETLKPLIVGVGCRKGISAEKISTVIDDALTKILRRRAEIREIATIDLKAQEAGLLLGARLLPEIRESARRHSLRHLFAATSIDLGQLGPGAVARGAATLPMENFLNGSAGGD